MTVAGPGSAAGTPPNTGRPHLAEFDVLRGAAIIAVVYLHAYFTPWPGASEDGLVALRVAHLFAHGAVPLFLFMSAYLQASAGPESPREHLARRITSVWLPAALWMVAALAYRLITEGSSSELWRDVALFNVSGQFYFVWLLLAFGLALTQAHRIGQRMVWWLVAAAFAINVGTIAWYAQQESIAGTFAILAYRNPLAWVFFPLLGYALGRRGIMFAPSRVILLALAAMTVVGAVYLFRGIRYDAWPVSYFGISVFLFSAFGMLVYPVLAMRLLAWGPLAAPLANLSRYAFPIYLVHLPFVIGLGTRQLLGDGSSWSNYWLLLHANALIGLLVSLAVVREFEKLSPRLARLALGVRAAGRRATAGRARAAQRLFR